MPHSQDSVSIKIKRHTVHLTEREDDIEIYLNDHFTLKIRGDHKDGPTVEIDSDEYPTRLVVKETESKWVT